MFQEWYIDCVMYNLFCPNVSSVLRKGLKRMKELAVENLRMRTPISRGKAKQGMVTNH